MSMTVYIVCAIRPGCWLGDPNSHVNEGKRIWVVDGDEKKVAIAESISDTPAKLAVALLSALFSKQEIAAGNCTPAPSRQTLNPINITGIRSKFPKLNQQYFIMINNSFFSAPHVQISSTKSHRGGGKVEENSPY